MPRSHHRLRAQATDSSRNAASAHCHVSSLTISISSPSVSPSELWMSVYASASSSPVSATYAWPPVVSATSSRSAGRTGTGDDLAADRVDDGAAPRCRTRSCTRGCRRRPPPAAPSEVSRPTVVSPSLSSTITPGRRRSSRDRPSSRAVGCPPTSASPMAVDSASSRLSMPFSIALRSSVGSTSTLTCAGERDQTRPRRPGRPGRRSHGPPPGRRRIGSGRRRRPPSTTTRRTARGSGPRSWSARCRGRRVGRWRSRRRSGRAAARRRRRGAASGA